MYEIKLILALTTYVFDVLYTKRIHMESEQDILITFKCEKSKRLSFRSKCKSDKKTMADVMNALMDMYLRGEVSVTTMALVSSSGSFKIKEAAE